MCPASPARLVEPVECVRHRVILTAGIKPGGFAQRQPEARLVPLDTQSLEGDFKARSRAGRSAVELVVVIEVQADICFERGRWRHPTRFVRRRADLVVADLVAPEM